MTKEPTAEDYAAAERILGPEWPEDEPSNPEGTQAILTAEMLKRYVSKAVDKTGDTAIQSEGIDPLRQERSR